MTRVANWAAPSVSLQQVQTKAGLYPRGRVSSTTARDSPARTRAGWQRTYNRELHQRGAL